MNPSLWFQESMRTIDHGQFEPLDHSFKLRVREFGGHTKSFGCTNSRVARSRRNRWIITSFLYCVSGFRRLGGISFDCRSHEEFEGSCNSMSLGEMWLTGGM
jgi:hypothetical protein